MIGSSLYFLYISAFKPISHFRSEENNVFVSGGVILVPKFLQWRLPRQLQSILNYGQYPFSSVNGFIKI